LKVVAWASQHLLRILEFVLSTVLRAFSAVNLKCEPADFRRARCMAAGSSPTSRGTQHIKMLRIHQDAGHSSNIPFGRMPLCPKIRINSTKAREHS
jgi:hypothetical protein